MKVEVTIITAVAYKYVVDADTLCNAETAGLKRFKKEHPDIPTDDELCEVHVKELG